MKKYIIGLCVLGLVTIGLTVYVISLGVASKQDKKTTEADQSIATKLNKYIDDKNKIPADLKEAGVTDAPDSIVYTKVSAERYKICVTYKTASGYGTSSVSNSVTGALYGGLSSSATSSDTEVKPYERSSYYPSYYHKKGENCVTVKPYLQSRTNVYSTDSLDDSEYCSPSGKYYSVYKNYCKNGELDFSTGSN